VHQGLERRYSSFVAFTAGNLLPVARVLRKLYPASPILFLADDDAYLEAQLAKRLRSEWGVDEPYKVLDGERELKSSRFGRITVNASLHEDAQGTPILTAGIRHGAPEAPALRTLILQNAGRTKAHEAAAEVRNAWVCWPKFADRPLSPDPDAPRLTDFNDLHCAEGIEVAARQAAEEIQRVHDAIELTKALAAGVAPGAVIAGGEGGGGDDGADWRLHWSLLGRFTLVERSGMAWDTERARLWRIEHMRYSFGNKAVNMWLASNRRRAVDVDNLVFDPRGVRDRKTTINLFRGLEMKPADAGGGCYNILKLLRYLCGEDEATETPISDWVLRWCAYQVQHVGAKMKTAVVMYGPEGTGKNLFWTAMLRIFDPYAVLIGQTELEDRFNSWQSAKLFVVANEVVTRAEMSHHVGRLKNMITEDKVSINSKFQDTRYEDNFMNVVFLSNEFQPLKISPGDRRYMVVRTPAALSGEFYQAVAKEIYGGGCAAFMAHLAELDLGDFTEHAKPLVTEAKRELAEIGMLPSQLYWQEIKEGLLELPYVPCLSEDLYAGYGIWCTRRGHKMPEALNRFSPAFMSMNGVRRREVRLADPDQAAVLGLADEKLRKRRIFTMGQRPEGKDEREWIVESVARFRKALRAFAEDGGGGLQRSAPAGSREGAF
jgi:putative DNA primase/helicase